VISINKPGLISSSSSLSCSPRRSSHPRLMARATRSTALHQEKGKEKEKLHSDSPTVPVTPRSKLPTKKRKRGSIQDTEDQPAVKQLRPDPALKPEGSVEPDSSLLKDSNLPRLQNAGDVSIDPSDARKILDVLEMYASLFLQR
jgi:hypothetical protein